MLRIALRIMGNIALGCALFLSMTLPLFGVFPIGSLKFHFTQTPIPWAEVIWSLGFTVPLLTALPTLVYWVKGEGPIAWRWAIAGLALFALNVLSTPFVYPRT